MVTTEYVFQMECEPFISIIRLYFFMLWILTLWQLTARLVAVKRDNLLAPKRNSETAALSRAVAGKEQLFSKQVFTEDLLTAHKITLCFSGYGWCHHDKKHGQTLVDH